LNIERYLGVYSDKLPSSKTREDEFSKYGELVNAYKELAMDDESKQDAWTRSTLVTFDYKELPQDIKQVMEFWRRNYGETEPIELNENVIDAGVDARKATWIKNDNGNCDDLLEWENDTFQQFISEHGKTCLEKQAKDRANTIAKTGCGNFSILYNSVSAKDYDNTLKKLLPFMEKCNKENQYDKVDFPKYEKSDGKSLDDIEGKISNAKSGVDVTSRDLGNQGELIFRLKFDKSKAAAGMVGDLGTNNRYYWKELQSVLSKMNTETQADPAKQSNTAFEIDSPPANKKEEATVTKNIDTTINKDVDAPVTGAAAADAAAGAKTDAAADAAAGAKADAAADAAAGAKTDAAADAAVDAKADAPADAAAGAKADAPADAAAGAKADAPADAKADAPAGAKAGAADAAATAKAVEELAAAKAETEKLKQQLTDMAPNGEGKSEMEANLKAANTAREAAEAKVAAEKKKTTEVISGKDAELQKSNEAVKNLQIEKDNLIEEHSKEKIKLLEESKKTADAAALTKIEAAQKAAKDLINAAEQATRLAKDDARIAANQLKTEAKLSAEKDKIKQKELEKELERIEKEAQTNKEEAEAAKETLRTKEEESNKREQELGNELQAKLKEKDKAHKKELDDRDSQIKESKTLKGVAKTTSKLIGWGSKNGLSNTEGGSTNRRYSFKKLQKRKRANKSNRAQAKRGKRLNRSKKMRR
jgi:hypothetical protein